MIRVKVMISLAIDPEDYMIPSDGNVEEEIEETFKEFLYDIDGVAIKQLKIKQENIYDG